MIVRARPSRISEPGVRRLLRHYRRTKRRLPWRRDRDPYRIWIAETMLQQTGVDTVIPYYKRFLRRFPSVRSLARASVQEVLKVWEGLGYYARARNLHRAAAMIGRSFPRTAAEWRRLPGVGEYTSAAIASIVSGEPVAVVDGNVRRVGARLLGRDVTPERIRNFMQASMRSPGDFNQAVMELGQRICRPSAPDCDACPLAGECRWFLSGRKRPVPRPKKLPPRPHHEIGVGIVRRRGRVLIGRRPEDGLLGGLWEFPGGKRRAGERHEQTTRREVLEETGLRVRIVRPLMTVDHAYSHFSVKLHVFECRPLKGRARPIGCEEVRWVHPSQLRRYPFPAANLRIIREIIG
jgi:A/G-specific adenine glycosylase